MKPIAHINYDKNGKNKSVPVYTHDELKDEMDKLHRQGLSYYTCITDMDTKLPSQNVTTANIRHVQTH